MATGTAHGRKRDRNISESADSIYKLKVVIVGDISVGKTSLAIRFTKDKFDESYRQTIGATFISRNMVVGDDVITFQLWDTAGQERYRSLVPMYLRGAHIALIVYDVTDKVSFANVGVWLQALRHHGDLAKILMVANKCDLESVVDDEEALEFAQDNSLHFVKASAKTGANVSRIFVNTAAQVVSELKRTDMDMCHRGSTLELRNLTHIGSEIAPIDESLRKDMKKRRQCCH